MRRVFCLALLSACARDLAGQDPPNHTIYYPISLAVHDPPGSADPDEQKYLYVLSSNFDLRYNAGWVSVIDFDALADEQGKDVMIAQVDDLTALKVPSLGGALAIDTAWGKGVVPHRGGTVVGLLEVSGDGRTVSCGSPESSADSDLTSAERRTHCDRAHLLRLDTDALYDQEVTAAQLTDPFAAILVEHPPASGEIFAVIGHLGGAVLVSQLSVIPLRNSTSERPLNVQSLRLNSTGVGYLAAYPDPSVTFIVATSQYFGAGSLGSTLYSIDLARDEVQTRGLTDTLAGFELLGITFSPDAQLAFVANNRSPGAAAGSDGVAVLDARLELVDVEEVDGSITLGVPRPRFRVIGGFSIQGRPTELAYVARAGRQDLLAAVSFEDDAVFLFAPQDPEVRALGAPLSGVLTPVARFDHAGEGPFAIRHVERLGKHYLVVAAFFSHELLVYDVSDESFAPEPLARLSSEHAK